MRASSAPLPSKDDPVWSLRRDPLRFFLALAERADLVEYRPSAAFLLNHPEHVRHVLATHAVNYPKETFAAQSIAAQLLFGDGVVMAEGARWKRKRRSIAPAFHRERVAALAETIVRLATETARHVEERSVDLCAVFAPLSMRILGETLFGIDLQRDAHGLREAFVTLLHALPPRPPPSDSTDLRNAAARLDAIAQRIVRERRDSRSTDRGDLLEMLLDARDDAGQPLDDVELRDEIITLLIGGDENTALGLAWTLYFLARDSALQAEVHRELDALGARPPATSDLPRLPLLRACLDESLRLRPPVWAYGRSAREPDVIGGVAIPAGASVTICPWALHRHPAFFADPEEFRPARFLDESAERRAAYMPFGAGERVCVGRQLAVVESMLVLAVFLQRFAFEVDPEHEPELVAGVSLAPRDGIRVVVRDRHLASASS